MEGLWTYTYATEMTQHGRDYFTTVQCHRHVFFVCNTRGRPIRFPVHLHYILAHGDFQTNQICNIQS